MLHKTCVAWRLCSVLAGVGMSCFPAQLPNTLLGCITFSFLRKRFNQKTELQGLLVSSETLYTVLRHSVSRSWRQVENTGVIWQARQTRRANGHSRRKTAAPAKCFITLCFLGFHLDAVNSSRVCDLERPSMSNGHIARKPVVPGLPESPWDAPFSHQHSCHGFVTLDSRDVGKTV